MHLIRGNQNISYHSCSEEDRQQQKGFNFDSSDFEKFGSISDEEEVGDEEDDNDDDVEDENDVDDDDDDGAGDQGPIV